MFHHPPGIGAEFDGGGGAPSYFRQRFIAGAIAGGSNNEYVSTRDAGDAAGFRRQSPLEIIFGEEAMTTSDSGDGLAGAANFACVA